jgi:hypothetical protein
MGSTLGPNSGPRAGVILTHPNSFPFLHVFIIQPIKLSVKEVFVHMFVSVPSTYLHLSINNQHFLRFLFPCLSLLVWNLWKHSSSPEKNMLAIKTSFRTKSLHLKTKDFNAATNNEPAVQSKSGTLCQPRNAYRYPCRALFTIISGAPI